MLQLTLKQIDFSEQTVDGGTMLKPQVVDLSLVHRLEAVTLSPNARVEAALAATRPLRGAIVHWHVDGAPRAVQL